MQENALHGWRLADGQHMRMSGYPSKTQVLSFTAKGRWLATSGRRQHRALALLRRRPDGQGADRARRRRWRAVHPVACHPQHEMVAAGFADGLVLLAEIVLRQGRAGRPAGAMGGISALAWNAAGTLLAFGTEKGFCGILDLAAK
jgi:hypothetical protein